MNKNVCLCVNVSQVVSRDGHQFKWGRGSALHAKVHCAGLLCSGHAEKSHLCGQPVQLTQGETCELKI